MDDREFVRAFEACTLPPEQFRHRDHVRLAWLYLREDPYDRAFARFRENLLRYATSLGAASKYDEEITRTWMERIAARMQTCPTHNFEDFWPALPCHPERE